MLVLPPGTASARARALLVAVLVALTCCIGAAPATAAAPKSLTKKSKITAPKAGASVRGTLSGSKKCVVSFPGKIKNRQVTVTGPLSQKKPKTKKLSSKAIKSKRNPKRVSCTWKTTSFADGKYRLTFSARVRHKNRWWKVSIKRGVTVANKVLPGAAGTDSPQLGVGNARYVGRLETQWDSWLTGTAADPTRQAWMRKHMWGVVAHTTFFDSMTSWAPPALVYKDLYAIYTGDRAKLTQHPEWVLKDANGTWMSIPWGCNPGPCPQFAGDIGNPAFRSAWIAEARKTLASGYRGLWIDDANMEMRVGGPDGVERPPIDPRTGREMTFTDWRRYMAEFLEQIRRELPNSELVANALWFGGTSIGRDADPYIQRAYTAVDRLNLERGFNDDGLTFGSSAKDIWSVDQFMKFIDRMHDRGVPVTLDSAGYGEAAWEYNLAGFFLVDRGEDAVGELRLAPGQWWNGWDVRLGAPLTDRVRRSDGVYVREFQAGLVYLNPPRGTTKQIKLPRAMKRIDGRVVTSLQLQSGRGAVLLPAS